MENVSVSASGCVLGLCIHFAKSNLPLPRTTLNTTGLVNECMVFNELMKSLYYQRWPLKCFFALVT
jgi:hypothetical protein